MSGIKRENSKAFLLLLLGMLTAFGPFVTDMYLPSLPSMADYFSTSSSMVQLGLTTSMAGLALGQIFFGPLSDKYGRRPLLLSSMLLFIVSTLLCLYAPDIYSFVALRLIQGIAGAGGIVISRSVATDKFSGKELAKMLAVIGAINGVAPVAAPVVGGLLTGALGWKGIFVVLLIIGLILGVSCICFKESLPKEKRSKAGVFATFLSFGKIVRNRRYMFYVLQLAFAQGILFANIASSPFIVQEHYGFSPLGFSICFAVNAIAIGVAAALSVKFRKLENGTLTGCIGMVLFAVMEMVALYNGCNFWIYELLLFALLFMMGLTFTTSTILAMDCERQYAGAASALLGALCFASGGIVSPLVGLGDILTSTGIAFVVCAVCSLLCVLWTFKKETVKLAVSPV
ncbi:multidrug effflux MFS transporter [Bacteroides sp.]|uniref:multidrug effflux MFS transporter n=1 Tax=Bacteroides sp. TaxID=29523 RepID=UPI00261BD6B3|nr:multidrug effflux MFS transporter [Bacteroides sp.]MDD3038806.1 multidrug effflux MFS transporter [Bacteroides sp.]